MRMALECLALRRALSCAPQERLLAAEAEATIAEAEASDALMIWEGCNRRYHAALYAPGGGRRLLAAIAELQDASARYLFATWRDLAWQPRSEAEHRSLLEAYRRRDLETAVPLLAAHIQAAGRELISRLSI